MGIPRREQRRVLALDGKTLRGARLSDDPGETKPPAPSAAPQPRCEHLVAVLDQASGTVLGQVPVGPTGGELAAFATGLDGLDLDGVLVTADALHTQRGHADYLHDRGGHYLQTVKANQPRLLARLRALPWDRIGPAAREAPPLAVPRRLRHRRRRRHHSRGARRDLGRPPVRTARPSRESARPR